MSERNKIYFIYNPVAGKGTTRRALSSIIEIFGKAGYSVECNATTKTCGAEELALRFDPKKHKCLVVAGGDGTIDEVVRSFLKRDIPLPVIGYIPAGTANDFAASHGLPRNPKKAAMNILKGKSDTFDIGVFGENTYFTYIAAFGNFTHLSYDTPQKMKNALGHLAYVFKGLPEFFTFHKMKPYHIRIEADGVVYEDDYAAGVISNAKSIAGFTGSLADGVDLQDGLLEVTLIKMPKTWLDVGRMIKCFLSARLEKQYFDYFVASEMKIVSDEPIAYSIDGEFGGEWKDVTCKVLKRKLKLRVPKS